MSGRDARALRAFDNAIGAAKADRFAGGGDDRRPVKGEQSGQRFFTFPTESTNR